LIRSANPALRSDVFTAEGRAVGYGPESMTVQGTATKALALLLLLILSAMYVWREAFAGNTALVYPLMMGGVFGGLVVAIVTMFKKAWSPVTAPLYAILEGLALGGISTTFEMRFPGIAIQAVGLTMAVFLGLLLAYKTRMVQATDGFKRGVFAVTAGIAIFYLVELGLGFFGVHVPFIHESGPIGLAVSVGISIVAALNLIIDFDFIETGARQRAPKYMEWYGAFGLLVTLVWLYLELLRLLSKMRSRN
jgi:uncharacterized YccA/Bax inhibitor family protein